MLDIINYKSMSKRDCVASCRVEQPDAFFLVKDSSLAGRDIFPEDVLGYRRDVGKLIEGQIYVVRASEVAAAEALVYSNSFFVTTETDPALDHCLAVAGVIVDGVVTALVRHYA